jgi:hypothetical protein
MAFQSFASFESRGRASPVAASGVFVVAIALVALVGCSSSSAGPGLPTTTGDDSGTDDIEAGVSFPSTGNQYVDARRCPACHQSTNPQVTGFMSGATEPIAGDWGPGVVLYGPNLTPDMMTGIGSWNDDQISTAILSGIDNQGERLCPQMQHFPGMGMTELQSILGYLHSLKAVSHQATPSKCPPLKP